MNILDALCLDTVNRIIYLQEYLRYFHACDAHDMIALFCFFQFYLLSTNSVIFLLGREFIIALHESNYISAVMIRIMFSYPTFSMYLNC